MIWCDTLTLKFLVCFGEKKIKKDCEITSTKVMYMMLDIVEEKETVMLFVCYVCYIH